MRRSRGIASTFIAFITIAFVVLVSRETTEPTEDNRDYLNVVEIQTEPATTSRTQTQRYVTPSLAELRGRGDLPATNDHVLMLTRVPGAGAELLVLLLQRLQGFNAFKHIRLPPGDDGLLSTLQQELLVEEIISIIRQEAIPLSFDGDLRFLNFSAFARQAPAFVSVVRDPMDPKLLHGYKKGEFSRVYRGSISHFCGQDSRCTKRNNKWALKRAMDNVSRWYRVVGILDHIDLTLEALKREFPYFFNGAMRLYKEIRPKEKSSRYRSLSIKPSARRRLEVIYKTEIEFYEWLKMRLLNGTSDNG
ncbi:uronyl 2-sulfotransferase-like isoform X1 [Venturia canescens]|uniref:uronyl 2-sulfotransferase-like isoform X1 n=1 Tax=Venturia canescens TaxID=32260 RepID=UPI001C9D0048|nr:uronyl 2-sulfotransferase-like isoform X1 [Venturia canescens]